ncbi:MAG: hypothetical protein HYY43_04580 [Deltaproteobacteria bacterium]|nr:hypothetical protein [Deltaproteobacteria bacterium]MBI2974846.1 hypothetical protein [Deltaproteobacteria bacterium]
MVKGVIKTKDIIRHPIVFLRLYGFGKYFRLLLKGLSPFTYLYLNILPK